MMSAYDVLSVFAVPVEVSVSVSLPFEFEIVISGWTASLERMFIMFMRKVEGFD